MLTLWADCPLCYQKKQKTNEFCKNVSRILIQNFKITLKKLIGTYSNANHATFPFRCVHITDIGIGYISTMLALHTLYLRWCTQIRDFGLQHICGMRSMQILSLAGTCQTVQNSYYQDSHSCFHVKKEFMNSLKLIKRRYLRILDLILEP